MTENLENLMNSLEKVMKDNDGMLEKALKELAKQDAEKSKEMRTFVSKVKNAKTEKEARNNINEIINASKSNK